jgi:hypothetical protein
MNKAQVKISLCKMFSEYHVIAWLSTFPDSHVFDHGTYTGLFIDYINSLPNITDYAD